MKSGLYEFALVFNKGACESVDVMRRGKKSKVKGLSGMFVLDYYIVSTFHIALNLERQY